MLTATVLATALSFTIQVAPQHLAPGEPLRVTVAGTAAVDEIYGRVLGQELAFLPTGDGSTRIAFAGVDLSVEPGSHPLEVEVREPDGTRHHRTLDLLVEPKEYPTERLTVEKKYVQPPPEVAARIGRESAALRAIWASVTEEILFDGEVTRPLEGVEGRNFGRRRVFNGKPRSPHSGADLSAPTGTPVGAAAAGRVVMAEEQYFSGNLVVIDHGGAVYTVYAHLSRIDVSAGHCISAGETVGLVGATGRTTGPHLHWGARIGSARVNPSSLLKLLDGP